MFDNVNFFHNVALLEISCNFPKLTNDNIHYWCFDVEKYAQYFLYFYDLLSDYEKERTQRFKLDKLKLRYTVTHGLLRYLLSNYISMRPEYIKIVLTDKGKPELLNNIYNIYFNISHSGKLIVIAIAKSKQVGVDIENIDKKRDIESIINICFNNSEKNIFKDIKDSSKLLYFYYLWTFKEALLKASGIGIRFPIKEINLTLSEMDLNKPYYEDIFNFNNKDFVFSIFKLMENFISSLVIEF